MRSLRLKMGLCPSLESIPGHPELKSNANLRRLSLPGQRQSQSITATTIKSQKVSFKNWMGLPISVAMLRAEEALTSAGPSQVRLMCLLPTKN